MKAQSRFLHIRIIGSLLFRVGYYTGGTETVVDKRISSPFNDPSVGNEHEIGAEPLQEQSASSLQPDTDSVTKQVPPGGNNDAEEHAPLTTGDGPIEDENTDVNTPNGQEKTVLDTSSTAGTCASPANSEKYESESVNANGKVEDMGDIASGIVQEPDQTSVLNEERTAVF